MPIGAVLGFLVDPLKEVLATRKLKKEAQAEVLKELARAEVEERIAKVRSKTAIAERKAQADVDWETIWARQAEKSWKDEYWTITLSLPAFAGVFFPERVLAWFQVLEQMPQWYQVSLMSAIGAAFGLRALTKFNFKGKN